ncbi:hypothetical protein TNIN_209911 [Trichonephila inaurata madagascariensis]|uniref:Uncharacterized protein n=1 Tax=Trichonephila inaurata madagascariensis TaxID=2747483 RepID=A0A8X6YH74_9ARAC|nr:hypothetical protein TNIN_209911 [Trichonephila inaurata madagascariensis]
MYSLFNVLYCSRGKMQNQEGVVRKSCSSLCYTGNTMVPVHGEHYFREEWAGFVGNGNKSVELFCLVEVESEIPDHCQLKTYSFKKE